jgi:hypothetical protein
MPIWHDEYRDYRISYQGDQRAIIMPPNSETPLPDKIEAEPGEGRVELRSKAHMAINADISAKGEKVRAA